MITIAVTGGVGTGKSTFVRLLRELLKERIAVFDCDASVHELLTTSPIIGSLIEVFGEGILSSDGQINRENLRELVFDDTPQRRKLEAILHPEVLNSGREARTEAAQQPLPPEFFVYEVPLLYEVEFPIERDADIVVAASRKIQEQRLKEDRMLSNEMIDNMISSQISIERKIDRADMVVWNDGPEHALHEQACLAIGALESRFQACPAII